MTADIQQQPLRHIERHVGLTPFGETRLELQPLVIELGRKHARRLGDRPRHDGKNGLLDIVDVSATMRLTRDDRQAQSAAEFFDIDADAASLRHVPHVQHEHGRQTEIEHLTDEVQVPFEVRRIGNADHGVNLPDIRLSPEQHFDRHHLVERARRQAVRSRQIDEFDFATRMFEVADLFLDRHAGIVSDVRMDPGECGEERALAGIRVANHGDSQRRSGSRQGGRGHASGSLRESGRAGGVL